MWSNEEGGRKGRVGKKRWVAKQGKGELNKRSGSNAKNIILQQVFQHVLKVSLRPNRLKLLHHCRCGFKV